MGRRFPKISSRTTAAVAVAAAALFLLYFAGLGRLPLADPDEPVYGQVAKEMAGGAGWLTPHYGGSPWFDKPPLFYWLSAVSMRLLGPTELAARLPSAIAAVCLVLLVYALASYDFGRRGGLLSAVVMATCLQQIVLARAAVTDMVFALCLTAALYAFRRWIDSASWIWTVLCGAATGLAMLTKGPVAPVILGATFVIYLWWTGRLRRLLGAQAAVAVLTALVVGLPWYAAMYALHRDTFVQGFLVANNVTRFLKAEHASQTGGWYSYLVNVPILLMFMFPWSPFLVQALRRHWRENDGAKLATVWIGVVFVFFSLSKTILVTYIFPLYPAAAVLVGALWLSADSRDPGAARAVRRGLWIGCVLAVFVAAGLLVMAHSRFPSIQAKAALLGGVLLAGMGAALVGERRSSRTAVRAIGTAMVVFASVLSCVILSAVSARVSTRELAERLEPYRDARFVSFGIDRPSLLFYLGKDAPGMCSVTAAQNALKGSTPTVLICREPGEAFAELPGVVRLAQSGGLIALGNHLEAYGKSWEDFGGERRRLRLEQRSERGDRGGVPSGDTP